MDGHGQRLAVQELLLRGRELGPAARRPRAPHPLAARHRGRAPLLLARHARERVAHLGMKSETGSRKPPREIQARQERRIVDWGASKSAKASESRETKGKGRNFKQELSSASRTSLSTESGGLGGEEKSNQPDSRRNPYGGRRERTNFLQDWAPATTHG